MTVAVLFALALFGFLLAAWLYRGARMLPELLLALGLAFLTIAIGVTLQPVPPEPGPEPPVTTDFGGYRPHYQGHGTRTPGGRGGEIRRVSTAQQLQAAVQPRAGCTDTPQTCARIIVFDASGNYDVGGQLAITTPYLTIAGQTAPDDGVTLTHTRFLIDTHDVVVQHLRVRQPPVSLNACSIGDAGDGGPNDHVHDVVFDHVTCTWSLDVNNLLVAASTIIARQPTKKEREYSGNGNRQKGAKAAKRRRWTVAGLSRESCDSGPFLLVCLRF